MNKEQIGILVIIYLGLLFFVSHGIWSFNTTIEPVEDQLANSIISVANNVWVFDLLYVLMTLWTTLIAFGMKFPSFRLLPISNTEKYYNNEWNKFIQKNISRNR